MTISDAVSLNHSLHETRVENWFNVAKLGLGIVKLTKMEFQDSLFER